MIVFVYYPCVCIKSFSCRASFHVLARVEVLCSKLCHLKHRFNGERRYKSDKEGEGRSER
jgi:hypothetical protein